MSLQIKWTQSILFYIRFRRKICCSKNRRKLRRSKHLRILQELNDLTSATNTSSAIQYNPVLLLIHPAPLLIHSVLLLIHPVLLLIYLIPHFNTYSTTHNTYGIIHKISSITLNTRIATLTSGTTLSTSSITLNNPVLYPELVLIIRYYSYTRYRS